MTSIRVDGLTKHYRQGLKKPVAALRGISFQCKPGAIYGLLGSNGAGKSTTINILSTLLRPDAGEVRIGGLDVRQERKAIRGMLGVGSDQQQLHARLSARQILQFAAGSYGIHSSVARDLADKYLEQFDLLNVAAGPAANLSQGQAIKLKLARAIIHDPDIVLFDEPTNGLDMLSRHKLQELLLRLKRDRRIVLLSSHDLYFIEKVCSEIILIESGEIRFQGTPDCLMVRYGSTTLIDAYLRLLSSENT